jgi:hypothetical protein
MKKRILYFTAIMSIAAIFFISLWLKIKVILVIFLIAAVIGLVRSAWELAKLYSK